MLLTHAGVFDRQWSQPTPKKKKKGEQISLKAEKTCKNYSTMFPVPLHESFSSRYSLRGQEMFRFNISHTAVMKENQTQIYKFYVLFLPCNRDSWWPILKRKEIQIKNTVNFCFFFLIVII